MTPRSALEGVVLAVGLKISWILAVAMVIISGSSITIYSKNWESNHQ